MLQNWQFPTPERLGCGNCCIWVPDSHENIFGFVRLPLEVSLVCSSAPTVDSEADYPLDTKCRQATTMRDFEKFLLLFNTELYRMVVADWSLASITRLLSLLTVQNLISNGIFYRC